LKFVHDARIIHRDIKPSNIMRHRNGKLYLLDFGAVKQIANSPIGTNTPSTGIYSMGFAPPEQMSGAQIFPSTDLYALAVTAVILLTGEQDVTQLFDAYSNQWKWRSRVTVSPHLANILDKMLQAAASQRYQSAREVLQALDIPTVGIPPTHINPRTPPSNLPQTQTQAQLPVLVTPFSITEILGGAAFSGFEIGLIAIALFSLLKSPLLVLGGSAIILTILIFTQNRRWIEKWDLLIIPAISFAIVYFVPFLHAGLTLQQLIIIPVTGSLVALASTALFRLIYKLLSMLL
jgi:serine/threonine protein kinase